MGTRSGRPTPCFREARMIRHTGENGSVAVWGRRISLVAVVATSLHCGNGKLEEVGPVRMTGRPLRAVPSASGSTEVSRGELAARVAMT